MLRLGLCVRVHAESALACVNRDDASDYGAAMPVPECACNGTCVWMVADGIIIGSKINI